MNKKEITIPLLVFAITIVFAVISVAVFITNGKSKKWVARKMKIGGLLLTLSAAACNSVLPTPVVTCYDVAAPTNSMWMNGMKENGLEIMLDTSNVLTGIVDNRQSDTLTFAILNTNSQIVQSDSLTPVDGKFDSYSENFKIEIDTNLSSGNYSLKLYDVDIDKQSTASPKQEINLKIKNE